MRALSVMFIASLIAVPCVAGAQQSMTGLGQPWPNSADVSSNPNFHVYVFERGNTRYIQVNDANGTVRAAFARTSYSLVGLPVGVDATNVATQDEPLPPAANTVSQKVYEGNGIQVFVAPQSNGTNRMMAVSSDCKGDPIECTTHKP